MGKVLECIGPAEEKFIAKQKVFFVGTAPLSANGHINVSPKSPGTSVVVLDKFTVAYADLSGSGAETAAHVLENERMTLLFCNLEVGPPKLMRIHGTAKVIVKEDVDQELLSKFPNEITKSPGFRAVYIVTADRISSSCGYSMPVMTFEKYRQTLHEYTNKQGFDGMREYGIKKNSFSIDGLPTLSHLRHDTKKDGKKIVPNPAEGYIFGKLVDEGSSNSDGSEESSSSSSSSTDLALAKLRSKQQSSSWNSTSKNSTSWNWLSFLCGIIVGSLVATIVIIQYMEMEVLGKSVTEIDL